MSPQKNFSHVIFSMEIELLSYFFELFSIIMEKDKSDEVCVVITEDHPITRMGLCSLVSSTPGMKVVGEASSAKELASLLDNTRPDVLMLDLMLPDTNGFDLLRDLKDKDRLPPTLVVSMFQEDAYAKQVLKSGAMGYIMKDADGVEIINAIREVANGELYVSAEMKKKLLKLAVAPENCDEEDVFEKLSFREGEVLMKLGLNLKNHEIAEILGVSRKTVATYKARLRDKFNCETMEELEEKAVKLIRGPSR